MGQMNDVQLSDKQLEVIWEALVDNVDIAVNNLGFLPPEDREVVEEELIHKRRAMEQILKVKPEVGEKIDLDALFQE